MGVRCLTKYVEVNNLRRRQNLRDCSLVIDGACFTAHTYVQSGTDSAFGGDYDIFAKHIKNLFDQFKKCNIKCYVVLGRDSFINPILLERMPERLNAAASLRPGDDNTIVPLLSWSNVATILEEMNVPHNTNISESEGDIIELARHLGCAILSNDSDFFLSDVPFVALSDFNFDHDTSSCNFNLYELELLLQKFEMNKEMMPIFFLLLQDHYLENEYFKDFFSKNLKIHGNNYFYNRIDAVVNWLSQHSYDCALNIIFRYVPQHDKEKCLDILDKSKLWLGLKDTSHNFIVSLFTDTANFIIMQDDWFQKGLMSNIIDDKYRYVYYHKRYILYAQVENYNDKDSFNVSLRILWYAFDLLTNFKNDHFYYIGRDGKRPRRYMIKKSEYSTTKPDFPGDSPFQNGWDNVSGYFKHFLHENLPGLDSSGFTKLPPDCRLFMVALLWFNHYSKSEHKQVVYCVILSYLWINVVSVKMQGDANDMSDGGDAGENVFNKELVTRNDCEIASEMLIRHNPRAETETTSTIHFDSTVVHALAQFQGCLDQLNSLNKLCGSMYERTKYHKVYNGSFICSSVYSTLKDNGEPGKNIQERLAGAGSVGRFYKSLCDVFEECANGIRSAHG